MTGEVRSRDVGFMVISVQNSSSFTGLTNGRGLRRTTFSKIRSDGRGGQIFPWDPSGRRVRNGRVFCSQL